jgi:outer membrane protein assembly factor BamB
MNASAGAWGLSGLLLASAVLASCGSVIAIQEGSSSTTSSSSTGGAGAASSSSSVTTGSGGGGGASSASSSASTGSGGSGGGGGASGASSSASAGSGGAGGGASSASSSASAGGGPPGATEAVAYGIDTAHTGSQSGEMIYPPFQQRWAVTLGKFISYPIIASGRVFVTVRPAVGNSGTSLYALDLQSGAILWGPVAIDGTFWQSNAAYEGGRVFVLNDTAKLRAFDATNGAELWQTLVGGSFAGSAPTARGGRVYISNASFSLSNGTVAALDAGSGQILWSATVTGGDNSSPAVTDTGVYVSYGCNQVYDFNPVTGAQIWHHQTSPCSGDGGFTPVLFGGKLYARDLSLSNLVLDSLTGSVLGSFATTSSSLGVRSPAFHGTRGFFVVDGGLVAKDVTTLAPVWTFPVNNAQVLTAPIVVNGVVYVLASSGMLYGLAESDGSMVWSIDTGGPFTPVDEYNLNLHPLSGLAAAAGALVVPAGPKLIAYW